AYIFRTVGRQPSSSVTGRFLRKLLEGMRRKGKKWLRCVYGPPIPTYQTLAELHSHISAFAVGSDGRLFVGTLRGSVFLLEPGRRPLRIAEDEGRCIGYGGPWHEDLMEYEPIHNLTVLSDNRLAFTWGNSGLWVIDPAEAVSRTEAGVINKRTGKVLQPAYQ